jgi:hypothetical protein
VRPTGFRPVEDCGQNVRQPHRQNAYVPELGGEGRKKDARFSKRAKARSQNICPVHLIRAAACADGPKKLLREKEE